MDESTRIALASERIDLLAGMVQRLRGENAAMRVEIDCLRKWLRDLLGVDDQDIDQVVARMRAPDIEL
jgi:hypothetical protein